LQNAILFTFPLTNPTLCFKKIKLSPQKGISFWNFVPFGHGTSTIAKCDKQVAVISLSPTTYGNSEPCLKHELTVMQVYTNKNMLLNDGYFS